MNNYTVKSFKPNQIIMTVQLSEGKNVEIRAPHYKSQYVVFGPNGKPVFKANLLTKKQEMECYARKNVAQEVADYYNRQTVK